MIDVGKLRDETHKLLDAAEKDWQKKREAIIAVQNRKIEKERKRIAQLPANQATVEEMDFYKRADGYKFFDDKQRFDSEGRRLY